jgi:hypothetical protein
VESQFTGSSKAYASSLIKRLVFEKYTGGCVRDHILRMSNVAARLKPIDLGTKDGFLIYLIFNSLLKKFKTFEVNYNSMNDKWTLETLIAICVQEEERIKHNNDGVDSVNMAKHHQKRKNFPLKPYAPKREDKGKAVSTSSDPLVDKDQCMWCKKRGNYQKNCIEFLKHLNKQGEDHVTFVDEPLFWVMQNLLCRLIHVQLFMLQILCRDFIRGGPFEEEKEALESPMTSRLKLKQLENFH